MMAATIELLSEELLVEIFSHYIRSEGHEKFSRNIPKVSRAFYEASKTLSLWRNVRARNWNFLLKMSQRGLLYLTQSIEFECHCEEKVSVKYLTAVMRNIRELKTLHLNIIPVGSDTIKLVTGNCPRLEGLRLKIEKPTTSDNWDQFLTICGPTLKSLELCFAYFQEGGQKQLLSEVPSKCPLLRTLVINRAATNFPILELRSQCPMLQELEFSYLNFTTDGRDDSFLGCGFRYLKKFKASHCDFSHLNVNDLLKDSKDLEHLALFDNKNLVFERISKIPSEKIRILKICFYGENKNKLKDLQDAVLKWRYTLSELNIMGWYCDITNVLKRLLFINENPQLKSLVISGDVDPHFFEKFIEKCQNLSYLKINSVEYEGREEIKESLEFLMRKKSNSQRP